MMYVCLSMYVCVRVCVCVWQQSPVCLIPRLRADCQSWARTVLLMLRRLLAAVVRFYALLILKFLVVYFVRS